MSVDNHHSQTLNFVHISYDDYAKLVSEGAVDAHTMYMLSADGHEDMFGSRIANVGKPISADDATTKEYVDVAIGTTILDYVSILRPEHSLDLNLSV